MKKKICWFSILIIVIGIIVVAIKGFAVSPKYKAHKTIIVPINADYNLDDIKNISNDIFGKNKNEVEKAGEYGDSVAISVKEASDDQINTLKDKLNEKYSPKKKLTISIGKEDYNIDDIKAIANEVFNTQDSVVTQNKDDKKIVEIEANIVTEKQLEDLNNKINEKFGITNEVSSISGAQKVEVNEIPKVRLSDMAKQYGMYILISFVIIVIYFAIRFRRLGAKITIGATIGITVISEAFYMAIIAITRYPVDKIAIMGGVAIYIFVLTYFGESLLKNNEALIKQEEAKLNK